MVVWRQAEHTPTFFAGVEPKPSHSSDGACRGVDVRSTLLRDIGR